jgi:ribosomal protein S17E
MRPHTSLLQPILTDSRLRAASAQLNTTTNEPTMVASAEEDKRIEHVRVDIELKSLVNRIKGMTTQIKDRVKKQKEISESIISEKGDE